MDYTDFRLVTHPRVSSRWSASDLLGALRVRFSIGRNKYAIDPGLYKIGNPGKDSEVLVTANYKLSFDTLRKNLSGIDAWILVLQTYGVNVWCAAGKGSFGTSELVRQINKSELGLFVSHNRVIVPQLGAPGISGYKVKDQTGFSVKFGPVRASDIKNYLHAGLKKTEEMRQVKFSFYDRLVLAPVEIMNSLKYLLLASVIIVALSGISRDGYSFAMIREEAWLHIKLLLAAYISGALLSPALLPLLPTRYFGGKGLFVGIVVFLLAISFDIHEFSPMHFTAWFLISGAVSSYLAMNFTGASTYTSLSGVRKEMRFFVPLQLLFTGSGLVLFIISRLI